MQRISRNVHLIDYKYDLSNDNKFTFLLISDIHFDNPHCKRDLLIKHLDYAKENNIPVFINGDLFCVMQGRNDNRRGKSNILSIHNRANYIDAVINEAVDWFEPYKDVLKLVGYGNHETAILKFQETDILQRFTDLFNYKHNAQLNIGGYGGWIVIRFNHKSGGASKTYKIKYFHGSGGGGVVTKGVIQLQRMNAQIHGANCIWQGHVHELYNMYHSVETLNKNYKIKLRDILHIRTSTYKEEYGDGFGDFHVERGRSVKPLGGYLLNIEVLQDKLIATPTPIKS